MRGVRTQSGGTGAGLEMEGHLYERDLNLLGEESVFGLLDTVRTGIGQRGVAEYLLKDDPTWTPKRIAAVIAKGREAWVNIPKPLPVHLVYWTAWVDDAGTLQLRDDIYGRDKPLLDVLGTEKPAQPAAP